MSKVCPRCGCLNIEKEPDDWYNEDLVTCMRCDMIFPRTELADATVFQYITQSPQVLARSLCGCVRVGCFSGYYSMLTGMYYPNMEEAIAATLEKLKEVRNG